MKKKLIRAMLLLALLVTAITLVFFSIRLYDVFTQRAYGEMKSVAAALSHSMAGEESPHSLLAETHRDIAHLRISWIDADGMVLYDSGITDTGAMDSHGQREEIAEALESGEGMASRLSASLGESTYYYATRLVDGSVLRLAQSQRSVAGELLGLLPSLFLIALLVVALSIVLSSRITRHVLGPLNRLNLDRPAENETYEELEPLLKRLIHQREQIDAQLRASEENARQATAILDNMAEGLLILSPAGHVMSMNRAAAVILSPSNMPCADGHYTALLRNLPLHDAVEQAMQRRTAAETKARIDKRTYHVLISPVLLDGEMTGAIVLLLDITEREAAETARREFSANVSHELKTPLTTIVGYAEMIGAGLADAGDTRMLGERIREEAKHLVSLIEDIIALSRLDETAAPIQSLPVELYALAQGVMDRLASFAAAQNVTLALTGEPCVVEGASALLEEMLRNLVDNAIRYNVPGGQARVRVWQDADGAHVSVADTGVGIDQTHHDRIFERFYRVDKSHSRETGGTGLGLSIVKHCVQIHGGRITLRSEPGKGTAIEICFAREDLVP